MSRDIRAELAEAVTAKDFPALTALAYELFGRVRADDERRARLAGKKRKERESRDVAGQAATSQTGKMSRDVAGRRETTGDVADTVQDTTTKTDNKTPRARPVRACDGDEKLRLSIEAAKLAYGDEWPDIEAFLARRDYGKWQGWLSEMAKALGPGSQFTVDDLGRVCRDDGLLKDPIGTAYGLRRFLTNARIERIRDAEARASPESVRPPTLAGARPTIGARTFATALEAIEDL